MRILLGLLTMIAMFAITTFSYVSSADTAEVEIKNKPVGHTACITPDENILPDPTHGHAAQVRGVLNSILKDEVLDAAKNISLVVSDDAVGVDSGNTDEWYVSTRSYTVESCSVIRTKSERIEKDDNVTFVDKETVEEGFRAKVVGDKAKLRPSFNE